MLGTVSLVEKAVESSQRFVAKSSSKRRSIAKKVADVMLRYNFPGSGLADEALGTLILLVFVHGRGRAAALIA